MNQLSLLSGTNTAARSCENEPQKDGSLTCKCGKGTLDCSIHPNTPEKWIASMQDSLARILALPANRQELAQKHGVASTAKSSASLGWFDPNTCSLKTSQQSLITDSEQSLQTLPRSGMTRNGFVYELPIVGRNTIGIDGGVFPTVTATANQLAPSMQGRYRNPILPDNQTFFHTPNTTGMDGGSNSRKALKKRQMMWPTPDTRGFVNEGSLAMLSKMCDSHQQFLEMTYRAGKKKKAKYWPTPQSSDNRDRGNLSSGAVARRRQKGKQIALSQSVSEISGQLNPTWVEWLMGFPIEYSVLKDSEMPKSRSKQR